MTLDLIGSLSGAAAGVGICVGIHPLRRWMRRRRYTRGRQLDRAFRGRAISDDQRVWGAHGISKRSFRQHLLAAGTSGSGKSLLLRRTLKEPLLSIQPGSDRRVFCYDSENDIIPYLRQIGVSCPVYSLNPMEARSSFPMGVRWDVARDITNPAKALNLAAKFVPDADGDKNKFFSDSARILLWGVINSFIRHSPEQWTYSDLIYASLSSTRVVEILNRDSDGREKLAGVFRDAENMNVTADNIFSTLYSKMAFHTPVAALWQRTKASKSIREWMTDDSILMIGNDQTMEIAFDLLNEILFDTMVEELSTQSNSRTRETIAWLDELRLCKPVVRSKKISSFLLQMRKKGGVFVGGFQDIQGFRHAAGSKELADEIIGQCSHKALLRLESAETAKWAAELLGQYETIETFESHHGDLTRRHRSLNEQRILKDNVLPSEFFSIEEPNENFGVEGYFISPGRRPYKMIISPREFDDIVVSDESDAKYGIVRRGDEDQWLLPWTDDRRRELNLARDIEQTPATVQLDNIPPFPKAFSALENLRHPSAQHV